MNYTDNGFRPIEDWTPPASRGDQFVFWTCVVIAMLVLVW